MAILGNVKVKVQDEYNKVEGLVDEAITEQVKAPNTTAKLAGIAALIVVVIIAVAAIAHSL